MRNSRYIIGIDLGTTNISVTYVDTEKDGSVKLFKIPHFSARGELDEFFLFPSFCFFPDKKISNFGTMHLPWDKTAEEYFLGVFARDFGATVPNRFICSAKSWLCHSGVNRKEKILPWGSLVKEIGHSPLEITSYYLKHIKDAWDYKFGKIKDKTNSKCIFTEQNVVITVPASFDEVARELTIEAAKIAGYKNIHLLEEPLGAFYSWIDCNYSSWQEQINLGNRILIVDIGGGTCDFSLIELNEKGTLSRTVAGNHLLLGGDNIDIAIAKTIEKKWNTTLPFAEWLSLCQKTRQAKEELLSSNLNEYEIVLLSQGSSLVSNVKSYILKKEELLQLLLEGFFPMIEPSSPAPIKKSAIQKMGLPYEADPSISNHLLHFLKYAYRVSNTKKNCDSTKYQILFPDKVLFNGGAMIPNILRSRLLQMLKSWFVNENIMELESRDLSLAVSYGASYYGKVRRGDGVKVKTAASRSYYLKVANKNTAEKLNEHLLCVMPMGTDENVRIKTPGNFGIETNKAVSFPLYNSSVRINDKVGDFIKETEETMFISSLNSLLKYGKNHERKALKSEIISELTETGTLKIGINSVDTNHIWPLNFDVRLLPDDISEEFKETIIVDLNLVLKSNEFLEKYFSIEGKNENIFKEIENILNLSRNNWPLHVIRSFADTLLKIDYKKLIQPEKEARYLNICGYCLRPGFGDPEDEIRLRKVWNLWYFGMNNPNNSQTFAEWWVFWRRVVSGLRSGHQLTIFQELNKQIFPKGIYQNKVKLGVQGKIEMWRCLGALELIPEKQKIYVSEILLSQKNKLEQFDYWVISRLGARKLLHAPTNYSIHPEIIEKWTKILLMNKDKSNLLEICFCLSKIGALTEDRALNLNKETLEKIIVFLKQYNAPLHWITHLQSVQKDDEQELNKTLGDSIPLGIRILDKM